MPAAGRERYRATLAKPLIRSGGTSPPSVDVHSAAGVLRDGSVLISVYYPVITDIQYVFI
jgi:hypothetical protein